MIFGKEIVLKTKIEIESKRGREWNVVFRNGRLQIVEEKKH